MARVRKFEYCTLEYTIHSLRAIHPRSALYYICPFHIMDVRVEELRTPQELGGLDPSQEELDLEAKSKLSNDERPKRNRKPKTPISSGEIFVSDDMLKKSSTVMDEELVLTPNKPNPEEPSEDLSDDVNQRSLKIEAKQKTSGLNKSTYISMVHEAIVTLKERTGSSIPAIKNLILSKYVHLAKIPSQQINRLILAAIKTGVRNSRFVKIKCSYKINAEWTKKVKLDAQKKKPRDMKRKKTPVIKTGVLDDSLVVSDNVQHDYLITEEERLRQVSCNIEPSKIEYIFPRYWIF